jgi:hypothetical protein
MKPEQLLELRKLAVDNAVLAALLRLRDRGAMSEQDWSHYAITHLAIQNSDLTAKAIDRAMHAPIPRNFIPMTRDMSDCGPPPKPKK